MQDGINTHGLAGYALQLAPNVVRLDQFFGQRVGQLRVTVSVNLDLWLSSHAAARRIDWHNDLIRGIFHIRRHRCVRVVDAGIRRIGIRRVFARHRRDYHIAQIFARVVGLYRVIKVHGHALAHSQLRDQGVSVLPYIAVSLHGSDRAGCIGKYVLQTDVGEIHSPVIRDGRSIADGVTHRRKSRVRKFDNGNAAPVHRVGIGVWLAVWIDRHNDLVRGILGVRVNGFLRVNAVSGVIRVFGVRAGHCGDGHVGDVLAVIRFHHFIRIGDRDGFAHRQPVDRPCAAVLVPGVAGAVRSGDSARAVVGVAYWDVFQLHAADVGHCDFVGDDVPHSRSFPVGFFFCFHAPQLRHRGGIGVWVRIRLNNNGPAVDVQRAGLEIHHIIFRAVGIGVGRQAGQLHGIAAHVGGRCGVRHKDRLALQIAVWRIAVDETVVRGCKFRERVAVDHAVFSRADHQRARSDSDAARFIPDDVVSQYRVIFFGQADILKRIVTGFRFCGDRSVFKAALICVQRQRVICHQRGNLQLGAAAALGCGILCRRSRFLGHSVAVAGGEIADKCADGAASDCAAVLLGLDLIVPIRVIVQADLSRAGDFVLKQLVFRILLRRAVRG